MPPTNVRGTQLLNNTVQRQDLDTSTVGQAVVTKLVQGTNVTLSSTGADSGTGDVTINVPSGGTGPAGTPAWTTCSAFTVPAVGATVSVTVADASWIVVGEMVYVDQAGGGVGLAGALQVTAKTGNQLTLLNPQPAPAIPPADATQAGLLKQLSGNTTDYVGGDNACHPVSAIPPADATKAGLLKQLSGSSTDYVGGDNACHPLRGPLAIRVFTTSGTYTPTAGMRTCIIECVGGGGAGGGLSGVANYYFYGGGGGAGGYSRKLATAAQIGASQVVTIGAQGAGAGGANGGSGGNTSVGSLCVANGGSGGGAAANGAGAGPGGAPGTGDLTCTGAPGVSGLYATGAVYGTFGGGGSSMFGGGAAGQFCNGGSWVPGINATGYGGGGGGGGAMNIATGVISGGAGGPGLVVITEYGL